MIRDVAVWLTAGAVAIGSAAVWRLRSAPRPASRPDASELVERAWQARTQTSLAGVQETRFREAGGECVTTVAEILMAPPGKVRLRYRGEPLAGLTVWDDGDKSYRYDPVGRDLTISAGSRSGGGHESLPALNNYDCVWMGVVRLAGRDAVQVELRPQHGGTRRSLCLDAETHFILSSEDYDVQGRLMRSTRFRSVDFLTGERVPGDAEFQPPATLVAALGKARPGESCSSFQPAELAKLVGFAVRQPRWKPSGFRLTGAYPVPCACPSKHQAVRLEFSDGIQTLSLFECGHPRCNGHGACLTRGGVSSLSANYLVQSTSPSVSLLAVGALPREQLLRLARSVEQRGSTRSLLEPGL